MLLLLTVRLYGDSGHSASADARGRQSRRTGEEREAPDPSLGNIHYSDRD